MSFFFRTIGYVFGIVSVLGLMVAGGVAYYLSGVSEELPDYTQLKNYEPPVMTRVHADDGSLLAEYATERRLFLPVTAIPDLVKSAFISAEDKNFYSHGGLDYMGIGRAVMTNLRNRGSGRRPIGASTITQQVAKNFLLTNEVSIDRKIKEALLSMRIETTFSKDKILELYLNEIYLGMGSYGVAAAALDYFNKSVHELTIAEAAYLAALPKAPNNYHPFRHPDRAIERRNWVIDRMAEDGVITPAQAETAKAEPLVVTPRQSGPHLLAADYFAEAVRRELAQRYGEKGLYGGGLSVRATVDPQLQVEARRSLIKGLLKFDVQRGGWRGPVATLPMDDTDWGPKLAEIQPLSDVPEWQLAVVLSVSGDEAQIGLRPEIGPAGQVSIERDRGRITLQDVAWRRTEQVKKRGWAVVARNFYPARRMSDFVKPGDVVYVQKSDEGSERWRLRQVPEVGGALVAMDPHTGRVLAMVGGFSFAQSEFNRATQALRQPGSSFKPFVYATALDNGYTPSSVVLDAPIELSMGRSGEVWRPKNYGGKFYGPSTLRVGIEQSRNVMTVRLAQDLGMPIIAEYAKHFGIYDNMPPVLAMALGAGETTVLRLTSAYALIANGGRQVKPTLIDRIQDRWGRTVYRHDERLCEGCVAEQWSNQAEPVLVDNAEQVLDPMTAYQITSMMEGVVQRGTAKSVMAVGKPIAGKTGTTNDEKDAWFVGFSPDLVVGVFIGYDQPWPMGKGATGGVLSAPVFTDFMKVALADKPPVDFRVPEGMTLIPIDRKSGRRASPGGPGVIIEAFKPGTGPSDTYSVIGMTAGEGGGETGGGGGGGRVSSEAQRAVTSGTGGLY